MDLIYLLKENIKNFYFNSLITGRIIENLSYLLNCLLSQRWRFRRIRYYEGLNPMLLVQKYWRSSPTTFYGLEAYGVH